MLPPNQSQNTPCCIRRISSGNWITFFYHCCCFRMIIINLIYWNVVSTSWSVVLTSCQSSSVSCILILHKLTSSIYYMNIYFCDILTKLEISMFPKALEDSCKSLNESLDSWFNNSKTAPTAEFFLRNASWTTFQRPILRLTCTVKKDNTKTNMSKVLMLTTTTHTICGTLHSFILKSISRRQTPTAHSVNQILYFWQNFQSLNTGPKSRPSKVRKLYHFFRTQSISTLDGI